jgi:hypothetical protein
MAGLRHRAFAVVSVCSLLAGLAGVPGVALAGSCSVKAAATTLGEDVWIHATATCSAGVRAIRYFVGDTQVGESAGGDGFATYHPANPTGTLTIRVAAAEIGDTSWSHPAQATMSLALSAPTTVDPSASVPQPVTPDPSTTASVTPDQAPAPSAGQAPASPLSQLTADPA